jgi:hypothetical protein
VSDPWQQARVDVPEIQARAFRTCCEALNHVRSSGQSTSVLLHGEAGSGKTHLLSRLRSHWAGANGTEAAPLPNVVLIYVRLQTSPRRLWRHLRRCFAEDLLRPGVQRSAQLDRILLHRFAENREAAGDLALWWDWLKLEYAPPGKWDRTLEELFSPLDQGGKLGWDLCTVLGHLFLGRHRLLAQAWLRGDSLPEPALAQLGLGAEPEDEDEQELCARQIVTSLSHLAGPRIPVVFCFDQVEALQIDLQDRDALSDYSQFITSLYHETQNALLISCIRSSFSNHLKDASGRANWARMAAYQNSLDRLLWEDTSRLIRARLDSQPDLARLRADRDKALWPLDEAKLKAKVGTEGLVARELLALCAVSYEEAARGTVADVVPLEVFLERTWQRLREQALAANTVRQTDEIMAHGLPLLVGVADRQWNLKKGPSHRDLNLVLEGPDGRIGVSLCNAESMTSLAGRFRRLRKVADAKEGPEKLVLLRDVRLPISPGAKKTREHLDELKQQGVCELRPSAEVLAALQALCSLLSDAKAGNLAHNGEPLEPKTVQDWLAAHLPRDLQDLLGELLAPPDIAGREEPEDDRFDRLVELIEVRHVMAVEEAATELGEPLAALEGCIRRNIQHLGSLSGPPAVLFQLVPVGLEM